MKTKLLLFTDLHLNLWRSFGLDKKTNLPKKFRDQVEILNEIEKICKDEMITHVIIGGDIFHKVEEIYVMCVNVFYEFLIRLRALGIRVIFVDGNHDLVKRLDPEWYHKSNWVFSRDGSEHCKEVLLDGCKIRLIHYQEEIDPKTVKGYDVVVVHKQPDLINEYGYYLDGINWKTLSKNNRLVFFGHDHTRRILADNCVIMGPPLKFDFSDGSDKGIYIVDCSTWDSKFIKTTYPEYYVVNTEEEVKDSYNYYKVLNPKKDFNIENAVSVKVPEFFEERIKSTDFIGILKEWVEHNGVSSNFFDKAEPYFKNKIKTVKSIFKGKLNRVKIKGFLSIGKVDYKLPIGLINVSGLNTLGGSNGSGKTSIFEAIYWCLYEKFTKPDLSVADAVGDNFKDCEVSLEFSEGDSTIKVKRSRKTGLEVFYNDNILTDGLTKSDSQKKLNELLGFDENVYLASCYFSQENLRMLTELGDRDRTNMITGLLGFEDYDDLYDCFSNLIKDCEERVSEFEGTSRDLESKIASSDMVVQNSQSVKNDIDKRIHGINESLKTLDDECLKLEESKTLIEKPILEEFKPVSTEELEKKIKEETLKEDESREKIESLNLEINNAKEVCYGLERDTGIIDKDKNRLMTEIRHLESHEVGVKCSSCGSMVTKENVDTFIDEKKREIEGLDVNYKILKKRLVLNRENISKMVGDTDGLKAEIDVIRLRINNTRNELDRVRQENTAAEIRKNSLIKEYESKIKSVDIEIDQKKRSKSILFDQIKDNQKQLETLTERIKVVELQIIKFKEELEFIKSSVSENKEMIEIFDFWKKAFSPKGIKSLLLDRFCNQFNQIVNNYLSVVSSGIMGVVVSPTKTIGSGDSRNKVDIIVDIEGKKRKYGALSGGEKKRVDVSLCMALNRWVGEQYLVKNGLLGLIVLDELFSFVDTIGEENIASVLYNESRHKTVFLISHTKELSSYCDESWLVTKDKDGISTLESIT